MANDLKDVDDDYDFARSKYYNLIDKSEEAIELMLDLARESEHPRAFEVLSNMIKQNAEIADRLMDLQKKTKDIKTAGSPKEGLPNMTQNNLFVGSTTDLQKMLAEKIKDRQIIENESEQNQE